MKYIFTFLYILGTIMSTPMSAPDYCKVNISELSFYLPEGFEVTNTWGENGVQTMFDNATGNTMDILVDTKIVDSAGFDSRILSIRDEWSKSIINEEKLPDNGHVFHIKNASKIQPVDTIILLQKQGYVVEAYLMRYGDPGTHAAFMDTALRILRSIEQGGKNEKRADDCFRGALYDFGNRF